MTTQPTTTNITKDTETIREALCAPLSYAIVAAKRGLQDRNRSTTFTLERNGTHITFRVRRPKGYKTMLLDAMVGSDNHDGFEYIGSMNRGLFIKPKAGVSSKAAMVRSEIQWYAKQLWLSDKGYRNELASVELHHEGKCACCGRKLTNPVSIETGIGPECSKHLKKSKVGRVSK